MAEVAVEAFRMEVSDRRNRNLRKILRLKDVKRTPRLQPFGELRPAEGRDENALNFNAMR